MQISPGGALLRSLSGTIGQSGTLGSPPQDSRPPVPRTPPSSPAAAVAKAQRNTPPPVDPVYAVERIARAETRRDIPRGSVLDIQV